MAPRKAKTKLIKIEANQLRPHPTAQRAIHPSHLKNIKETLDLDTIGVLHCVEYEIDGVARLWIVDGQHRWQALMDLDLGEWIVEVLIHLDCQDHVRSSALFIKLNNKKSPNPFDTFDQHRKAQDKFAVDIARIATERNLDITRTGGDGQLRCVAALTSVWKADEGAALTHALDIILGAWGRGESALEGKLIEGLGIVFKTFNGNVDKPALVKKLAKYPGGPSGLIGDARGLRELRHLSVARCVAARMVETYNAGRKAGKLDAL